MQNRFLSGVEAIIVLPSTLSDNPFHPCKKEILGLTTIERNVRALEKSGVEHVTFLTEAGIEELKQVVKTASPWKLSFSFSENKSLSQLLKSYHTAPPKIGLFLFCQPLIIDPKLVKKLIEKGCRRPKQALRLANSPLIFLGFSLLRQMAPTALFTGDYTLSKNVGQRTVNSSLLYCPVNDDTDALHCENALLRTLSKPNDGWVSRHLNRPISTLFSRKLAPTSITPNQVTLAMVPLSLITGVVLAQGGYWGFFIGGALFHLTSVLDGVDGELARLKFKSSLYGKWLDFMCDNFAYLAALVGFFVGLFRDGISPFEKTASLTALTFTILMMTSIIIYYKRFNKDGKLLTVQYSFREKTDWLSRLMQWGELLGKREWFALLFFGLAIIGKLEWALVLICIITGGVLLFSFEAHAKASRMGWGE